MSWFKRAPPGPAPEDAAAAPSVPTRAPPHDYTIESEVLAHYFDFNRGEIDASIAACQACAGRDSVNRIAWFIPNAASAFAAGIHTILRVADYLWRVHGIAQVFCVDRAPSIEAARERIAEAYPELAAAAEIVPLAQIGVAPTLGPVDAAIATLWITALSVLRLRDVRRKLYFVQDWEPEFYPAGSSSALVEATYRFGFHALCSSPALAVCYREFGGSAEHFTYAVDTTVFHPNRSPRADEAPFTLFAYGRPFQPRNCYELVAAALHVIKAQLGDRIDIVLAGGTWDPAAHGLAGVARNLGMVPHGSMGDVYRSADIALCLTASRNPSVVMLELMACGTPVVTTRNIYHGWMSAGDAVWFESEPSRGALAATVLDVLRRPDRGEVHASRALALIRQRFADWTPACELVARAVTHRDAE